MVLESPSPQQESEICVLKNYPWGILILFHVNFILDILPFKFLLKVLLSHNFKLSKIFLQLSLSEMFYFSWETQMTVRNIISSSKQIFFSPKLFREVHLNQNKWYPYLRCRLLIHTADLLRLSRERTSQSLTNIKISWES